MRTCKLDITDNTTPERLDSMFTSIWCQEETVKLRINATACRRVSLGRVLSMKKVLDRHRPNSQKYIEDSTIEVRSHFTRRVLQVGLALIGTERPVYVEVIWSSDISSLLVYWSIYSHRIWRDQSLGYNTPCAPLRLRYGYQNSYKNTIL